MSLCRVASLAIVLAASVAAGCLAQGSDAGGGDPGEMGSGSGSMVVGPGTGPAGTGPGVTPAGGDAGVAVGVDSGTGSGPASGGSSPYKIDIAETSVSGFSSGAFFAVQFHVAFSSIIKGAAIFAGGPYDCAGGNANTAETTCLTGAPDATPLIAATKENYSSGGIDNPANLASEKVFMFGGADDSVVHPSVMDSLQTYYAAFLPASGIQYESRHAGASHTMPTVSYGGSCDSVASPFVGNCGYDGAGNALKQIYGALSPAATTLSGKMLSFSQTTFVANAATEGLGPTGYYYVPASCANGEPCKVHVSFHGCEQNEPLVQDAYYGHAGYNEWADTNHIIVLYPQAASSSGNSYECWDFWGYDGTNYALKAGTQLAAVRAMVDWLVKGGTGGTSTTPTTGTEAGIAIPSFDAGAASCVSASNTAQVAAGRATAVGGFAYATGSNEFLGADNATTMSSVEELAAGYYILCL